jgi:DNA-binding NtrC family response regulator
MDIQCVAYEPTEPADAEEEADAAVPFDDLDVRHAANAQVNVLVTGEITAAQALARRIHELSDRCQARLLAVDCRAPAAAVESVLGDALGLQTRTEREAEPWFRRAGTVVLRDVGRLDPALQRRLADMLAATSRDRRHAARVIATSTEPLDERVHEGTFDDTLYYRLNAIHLVVGPPLEG